MSLDDFLKNPYGSGNTDNQATIARASVWRAFEVTIDGVKTYIKFEHDADGVNEKEARLAAKGEAGQIGFTYLGLLTTIYAKGAIQSNFNDDFFSFVPEFHSKEKFYISAKVEERLIENGHLESAQAFMKQGPFPYDTVIEHLSKNKEIFESEKYCKLVQIDDELSKAKGAKNKYGYPWQFFVVDEVYSSRKEAEKEVSSTTNKTIIEASAGGALSSTAIENGWTLPKLQENARAISQQFAELMKDSSLPPQVAKNKFMSKIAEDYGIELGDIDLLDFDIPF